MLANELDYVLGVDTHRNGHVLAIVTAPAGAVIGWSNGDCGRTRLSRAASRR